jgi:hypothetical protein
LMAGDHELAENDLRENGVDADRFLTHALIPMDI